MVSNKLEYLIHWIVKLAYLNLLWFLFCLVGGILFGWAPSTVALFAIFKKMFNKENPPLFSTYLCLYKKEFLKSNVCGIIIVGLGATFMLNIMTLPSQIDKRIIKVFLFGNGTLIITFILCLQFFFPIYIHLKGGYKTIFYKTILVTLVKLPWAILAFILCLVWGGILTFFPGLIFFYSVSVPVLIITIISQYSLAREEAKLETNYVKWSEVNG